MKALLISVLLALVSSLAAQEAAFDGMIETHGHTEQIVKKPARVVVTDAQITVTIGDQVEVYKVDEIIEAQPWNGNANYQIYVNKYTGRFQLLVDRFGTLWSVTYIGEDGMHVRVFSKS